MRVERLKIGERIKTIVKGKVWIEGKFLGVEAPNKRLVDPKTAKMLWAEFYSRLLGRQVKPTWKDIYLAYTKAEDLKLVPYSHYPKIVIELDDGRKVRIYYDPRNGWLIGTGAYRVTLEPV